MLHGHDADWTGFWSVKAICDACLPPRFPATLIAEQQSTILDQVQLLGQGRAETEQVLALS